MIKQTLITILLLSLLTSYAQDNTSLYKTTETIPSNVLFHNKEIPQNFNNYYEGLVDDKHLISININNVNDNLTAVYTDYYQKDAIQLYGTLHHFFNYINFHTYGLRNAEKSHDAFDIISVEPIDNQTLVIRSHYLNKVSGTVLRLKNHPENYAYISKFNTDEFIEQAKIETQKESEFDIQDIHKTQWLYPYITHTDTSLEEKINQKIQTLVVHSIEDFKTTQEEIEFRQKNNLKTTLEERFVYSEPNAEAWDILINSLPTDSLYYTIHNVQVPYIANNIIQANSTSVNWSGDQVLLEYETKLINTQSADYITFEECFYAEAKDIIYTYLIQNHWKPEQLNKQIVDRMFGLNNYGISYQFYEAPIQHMDLKMNNVTVPFKLLNKYIKEDGPFAVFKRKK